MLKPRVTVAALPAPVRHGDFKDPPAKWGVYGPGDEVQIFSRKADALTYASVRRNTPSYHDALKGYARIA